MAFIHTTIQVACLVQIVLPEADTKPVSILRAEEQTMRVKTSAFPVSVPSHDCGADWTAEIAAMQAKLKEVEVDNAKLKRDNEQLQQEVRTNAQVRTKTKLHPCVVYMTSPVALEVDVEARCP